MNIIKAIFKKANSCNHDYKKIAFKQKEEFGLRYSIRLFKCQNCGKEKWIDGRKRI